MEAHADARDVLVPEIGDEIADRARHVVAVLLVLLEALNADAARIEEHELLHAEDHLADPAAHVVAGRLRQIAVEDEDEMRMPREAHVGLVATEVVEERRKRFGRGGIVEAAEELVEQRGLARRGHARLVLERVGDAAEEIRRHHRATERARKHANAEREGARHRRKDLAREAVGLRYAGILAFAARLRWRSVHAG